MPKFLVKSNISKDGKLYEPGAKVELSPEQAAEMPWAVEAVKPPKEEAKETAKAGEGKKPAEN